MVSRFCPKCGVEISQGTFCAKCLSEKMKRENPFEIPLIQVSEFQRVFDKGTWHPFGHLDDLIVSRVKAVVGSDSEVSITPYEFTPKSKEKTKVEVHVKLPDEAEFSLEVPVSYRQCDFGQKTRTNYFEGILQLRNPTDAIVAAIIKELEKSAKKGLFITKTSNVKDGVDLYHSNNSQMKIFAQKIHNRFGGTISVNMKLFSHNHETSKDIFRVNTLITFPDFTVGDVISFIPHKANPPEPSFVKIKKMGVVINSVNLMNKKNMGFELKYTSEIHKLEEKESSVLATHPQLLIMHPETFQGEVPRNVDVLSLIYKEGDKVSCVVTDIGLLIVE